MALHCREYARNRVKLTSYACQSHLVVGGGSRADHGPLTAVSVGFGVLAGQTVSLCMHYMVSVLIWAPFPYIDDSLTEAPRGMSREEAKVRVG